MNSGAERDGDVPLTTAVIEPTYSMRNSILTPERNIHQTFNVYDSQKLGSCSLVDIHVLNILFRLLNILRTITHVLALGSAHPHRYRGSQSQSGARVRSVDSKQISTPEIKANTSGQVTHNHL